MKPTWKSFYYALWTFVAVMLTVFKSTAAVTYWDPQGSDATNPYAGDLSGDWDAAAWSTSNAGQSPPVAWIESTAACFGVHTGIGTPPFTVTLNTAHTVAGFFDGSLTPNSCDITIAGTGSMAFPSGLQAANVRNSTDGSLALVRVNVPITGAGAPTLQGNGQVFLNATNTHTGGVYFGYSGGSYSGVLNFANSNCFGTGAIVVSNTAGGVAGFVYSGTTPTIVTNKITWSELTGGINIVGIPAGVTFSGPLAFSAATTNANLYSGGGSTNLVIMSGVLSGGKTNYVGYFNKANYGTLKLSGANTYALHTAVSNGVLQAGNNSCIPNGANKGDLFVAQGLDGNGLPVTGMFDVNGFSITCNGLFGDGIIDNTATGTGTITIGGNNMTSSFTGTVQSTKGILNVVKTGTGTLTLGTGTYSGATTINGGTLVSTGGNNTIPPTSSVTIANGATLDLRFLSLAVTNLQGRGNIVNNTGTVTVNNNFSTTNTLVTFSSYSGNIDNGTLVKTGNGSMSLRGTNNLVNGVQVNGGTLSVGAGPDRINVVGGSVLSIANGATFQLDAASQTIAQLSGTGFINLGGGTLNVNTPLGNTYGGVIRDSDLGANSTATGHGLRGYYYDNQDFTSLLAVRDDAQVNFGDFTSPTNVPPQIYPNTNQFSVRWLGQVFAPVTGTYTFTIASDDGSRLWVNGTPVIDSWVTQSGTARSGTIALTAGARYDIVVEYFNQTGGANCFLRWAPPGDTVATLIPSTYLFLPTAGSVVKDGSGSLQLTSANSYTGTTVVKGGTLEISAAGGLGSGNVYVQNGAVLTLDSGATPNYIADSADLILSASGSMNLNFSGTDTVRSLSTDGGTTFKVAGTYGAPGSGAQHEDSHFSGTGLIRVAGLPSTTTLGSSAATTVYGSSVTLTAVAHGATTPTGTITFFDGANAIGTVAVDGTGTAVLSVSDLLVGSSPHSVTAVYNGDATYGTSKSAAVTQTVTPITLTGVIGANKQYDQTVNAPLNLTNLIGVLPVDTNQVQLATNYVATFPDKNAGTNKAITASGISLMGGAAANYTIASTANVFGNISSKPLTVTGATASAKVYDGTLLATVVATNSAITGFATNVIYAGDDATTNNAAATGAFTNASVGTGKTVFVTLPMIGADAANYFASGTTTATITKGTSALALTSSANPANSGDNVSFTAAVTPTATGNVNFLTNGVLFATVPLASSSANSGVTTTLPVGTNTVTAQYAGDTNVTGSTNSLQQVINNAVTQPPTMVVAKSAGSITISWTGTFNLQSVNALQSSGTGWQTIPGAVSGYTTPTTNSATFYRLSN
jgi:autotransporter-associated beta strand protein